MNNGIQNHSKEETTLNNTTMIQPQSWFSKVEFIQHLTLFNNVLMLILSESRQERTHFLSLLNTKLDKEIHQVKINASNDLSLDAIAREISNSTTIKYIADTPFANYISQINERKTHVLLIVEQAEILSEPLLKSLLSSVKSQGIHGYFHAVLSSDYSLLEIFHQENYKQFDDLIHSIEVSGLNENELKEYISKALVELNAPSDLKITKAEFELLLKKHDGRISAVNQYLLSKIYAKPAAKKAQYSKSVANLTKFAATAIPLVFAAVAIGYLMPQGQDKNQSTPDPIINPQHESLAVSEPVAKVVLKSTIPSYQDSIVTISTKKRKNQEDMTKEIAKKLNEYSKREVEYSPFIVDKVVVSPKDLMPHSVIAKAPSVFESKVVAKKTKPKSIAPSKKPVSKKIVKKNSPKVVKSNKRAYTIQIMATHDLNQLKQFIRTKGLVDKAQIYHTRSKGQKWYVLAVGHYKNKNEALRALEKLSAKLSKNRPWIRSFRNLSANGKLIA